MSNADLNKVNDIASEVIGKMIESSKTRDVEVFSREESLSNIKNELNEEEYNLFKQKAKVTSEDLDNHYSDSFGNNKHKQQDKYSEIAKSLSDESINKVETLYEDNIYQNLGKAPKNEIGFSEIEEVDEIISKPDYIKTPEIDLEKEMDSHSKELNTFIDDEVINEKENVTNLTEDQLNGMLNEHFKRIEDVLHDYEGNNIDADTFKDKLKDLTNHVKENARSSFKKVVNKTTQPVKDLKRNAINKIDGFINKVNDKLKNLSHKIDSRNNEKETTPERELNAEQKIEQNLRNDPELFKKTLVVTQINSMKSHLENSRESLNQLKEISKDDPIEQYKINDMKSQLTTHIDGVEKELEKLENSHSPEQKMEQSDEQSKEKETEQSKEKTPKEEKEMER